MHRHKRFRHGPPLFRPGRHFGGWFWWIGLAILFSTDNWWPGILVLIGLSMVFGSFFREERQPKPHEDQPPFPPHDLSRTSPPPAPRPVSSPMGASFDATHRTDLLPTTCSQCGGPIRSYEVKWKGAQTAACPYCGSNLLMQKPH